MTEAKYNTALLLLKIEMDTKLSIQPGAVKYALKDIELTKGLLKGGEIINSKENFVHMLCNWNNFSIVAYPVKYHYDTFIDKCQSLENKICFSFDIEEKDKHIGRGGDGKNKFVYAILDHSDTRYKRRRAQYVAAGGTLNAGQKLTETMWSQQFGNLDGFHIDNNN